ncbi:MAG: hypothetical protein HY360_04295 [Verrucomicrobia bacterium]|nr:hypothetical protein [Verrucomicrobiota bacterium]
MLKAGDALLLPKPGQNTAHLWVLLTDSHPQKGDVLIVNLTTQRPHSDTTVILQPGDHRFVDHPTVVNYADARVVKSDLLESYVKLGTYLPQPALDLSVLRRIQDGLLSSAFTPNKIEKYFRAQMI